MKLDLYAPAKLNLFLHVVGRRSDGMHELQTLFRLVDLFDHLVIETGDSDGIRLTGDMADENNLVYRAAQLLAARTGCAAGARMTLTKHIPVEAGLGGGSSDAAATLLGLNTLWGTGLGTHELEVLGLELGADVPLFVRGLTAFGEGVGEQLTPVQLPPADYLLVRPDCSVSTAEVFHDPALTRNTPVRTIARLLQGAFDSAPAGPIPGNNLEPVVRRLYPAVEAAVVWASQFGPAKMTGSGSCVYVPLSAAYAAKLRKAGGNVPGLPEGWQTYVVRGIDKSPIHPALADVKDAKG